MTWWMVWTVTDVIKVAPVQDGADKMEPHFRSYAVICFFYVLFLTLLAQKISSVITYSREELLDKKKSHPPLPSILLANVQSVNIKVDEIRARVAFQRDRDCNIPCFTETWLTRDMLSVGTATWFLHASHQQKQTSLW